MGKRKNPEDYLRISEQNPDISKPGDEADKLSKTERRAQERVVGFWYLYIERRSEASFTNVEFLQQFIRKYINGIEGVEPDVELGHSINNHFRDFNDKNHKHNDDHIKEDEIKENGERKNPAAVGTALTAWKTFSRWRFHEGQPLPKVITETIRKYIQIELKQELGLADRKRPRRFGTATHVAHIGKHLWCYDWYQYQHPGRRVQDWAAFLLNVCSSSRIGEYFESSCRLNTDRGLHYKEVIFFVFINDMGNAERAFISERDAKNMTDIPHRRPQHCIYEGLKDGPLLLNPMLPHLGFLLANRAFKHYQTLEALFAAKPREGERIMQIEWADEWLNQPFYQNFAGEGVQTANSISSRHYQTCVRAGFAVPPRFHDFRAQGLNLIDELYSTAKRMKYAGHTGSGTHNDFYAHNLAADGQGAFFNGEGRTDVLKLFPGLSISWNSRLPQKLPAESMAELSRSVEMLDINNKLAGDLTAKERA
ncbi:hypothetical protein BX600DRAFT_525904 [Xylariales sp. PMI_506]|nr:hypothetical protein BX600DRAFT_525904 [Xylariales sp. PMI_506]